MLSRYQRKTDKKLFTWEQLTKAKEHIAAGYSIRAAARFIGANEATLRKRLKTGTVPLNLGRFKPTFSREEEEDLVEWIKIIHDTFYGVSKKQLMAVVYQYAERNNISHNFNKKKKMAGENWVRDFSLKYRLTLRQPEKCLESVVRFNEVQFKKFHDNLKTILEENPKLDASCIYSMDESNISVTISVVSVSNKLPKGSSKRKELNLVSQNCIKTVTAVCCMNAAGYYVPPAVIFPRKRYKPEFCNRAPPNTLGMTSDFGSINSELFINWLKHFTKYVMASQDRPVLLILDNHTSHISLPAIEYCQENSIILLSLPPYASHKLQPLEVAFFGSLKKFMAEECEWWMSQHPGRPITIHQIGEIFCSAYRKTASIDKAVNAFRDTGIFPQNPSVFEEENFMPASLTKEQSVKHPKDNGLCHAASCAHSVECLGTTGHSPYNQASSLSSKTQINYEDIETKTNVYADEMTDDSRIHGFKRKLEADKILGSADDNGKLMYLIQWKGIDAVDIVSASEANAKCPQIVIQFYEDRIIWKGARKNKTII